MPPLLGVVIDLKIIKVAGRNKMVEHSEDLNWALNRMKRRLGEILIEIGVLKDNELQHALALQKESSQET